MPSSPSCRPSRPSCRPPSRRPSRRPRPRTGPARRRRAPRPRARPSGPGGRRAPPWRPSGSCGSISIRVWARTPAAATRANGLSSAGITYQGAHGGAGLGEDLAERLLVVVPVGALLGVVGAELPVLLGLVDAGQEPAALLLLADVQEQLDEAEALVGQVVLPVVDLAEAPVPDAAVLELGRDLLAGEDLGVDPDDEDLLVVGAVEDADVAALGQLLRVAPQVVVVEVLGRGDLEAADLDALGVDAAHDVADRAVLAGGVHRLEDHDDAVGVLGREAHLVLGEQLDGLGQDLLRLRLGLLPVPGRVEVLRQPDPPSGLHPERLDELGDPLGTEVGHLGLPPWIRRRPGWPSTARAGRPGQEWRRWPTILPRLPAPPTIPRADRAWSAWASAGPGAGSRRYHERPCLSPPPGPRRR